MKVSSVKVIVTAVTAIFHNKLYSIDNSSCCMVDYEVIFLDNADIKAKTGKTTIRGSISQKDNNGTQIEKIP